MGTYCLAHALARRYCVSHAQTKNFSTKEESPWASRFDAQGTKTAQRYRRTESSGYPRPRRQGVASPCLLLMDIDDGGNYQLGKEIILTPAYGEDLATEMVSHSAWLAPCGDWPAVPRAAPTNGTAEG